MLYFVSTEHENRTFRPNLASTRYFSGCEAVSWTFLRPTAMVGGVRGISDHVFSIFFPFSRLSAGGGNFGPHRRGMAVFIWSPHFFGHF